MSQSGFGLRNRGQFCGPLVGITFRKALEVYLLRFYALDQGQMRLHLDIAHLTAHSTPPVGIGLGREPSGAFQN